VYTPPSASPSRLSLVPKPNYLILYIYSYVYTLVRVVSRLPTKGPFGFQRRTRLAVYVGAYKTTRPGLGMTVPASHTPFSWTATLATCHRQEERPPIGHTRFSWSCNASAAHRHVQRSLSSAGFSSVKSLAKTTAPVLHDVSQIQVFFVNLDRRTDRLQAVVQQIQDQASTSQGHHHGCTISRFSAVEPEMERWDR
jgi:hypothetical protein